MEIVLDAHVLLWLLKKEDHKLSKRARQFIALADSVAIPAIVLMELLYILKKSGQARKFLEALSEVKAANYDFPELNMDIINECTLLAENLEMHDAIIVATASVRDAFLVSKDKEIKKFYPKTVW